MADGLVSTCEQVVSAEDQAAVASISDTQTTTGEIVTGGLVAFSSASAADPGSLSIVVLMKMLQYIRYMNINYPKKVLLILKNQQESPISFNFGPKMTSELKAKFTKYPIPENFSEYEVHSNFLVGFWRPITSLLILIMIGFFFQTLEIAANRRSSTSWRYFFYRIRILVKWNLTIMILCINIDGVVLFSSLQYRTIHSDDLSNMISLVFSIFFCVLTIAMLLKTYRLVRKEREIFLKLKETGDARSIAQYRIFIEKTEGYHVLFKGFRPDSFMSQGYLLFFVLRIILFHLVIANLYKWPILQACLMVFIGIMMIIYVFFTQPFKRKINFY